MKITVKLKKAIEKYIEGKDAAFTDIYNESYKYVYVCVNNVVSGNDNKEDIIQDIMQDTYVEISKHIKSLENVDKFFSWAGTIATRKCYEYLKKSGKYTLLDEDENFDNLSDDDNIIPEEIMQNKEKQRLLREIIQNELTEMQRLCIVGYFYNEMKQSEIAKELGIPENSVKSHLLRAKAKIKEAVIELDEKKGTRLYSVSPVLLLLFSDEVKACTVSAAIDEAVFSSVGVSGVVKMSSGVSVAVVKFKSFFIAVAAIVTLGGIGAGVGIAMHNSNQESINEPTKIVEDIRTETVNNVFWKENIANAECGMGYDVLMCIKNMEEGYEEKKVRVVYVNTEIEDVYVSSEEIGLYVYDDSVNVPNNYERVFDVSKAYMKCEIVNANNGKICAELVQPFSEKKFVFDRAKSNLVNDDELDNYVIRFSYYNNELIDEVSETVQDEYAFTALEFKMPNIEPRDKYKYELIVAANIANGRDMPQQYVFADYNGDGVAEFLQLGYDNDSNSYSGKMYVYEDNKYVYYRDVKSYGDGYARLYRDRKDGSCAVLEIDSEFVFDTEHSTNNYVHLVDIDKGEDKLFKSIKGNAYGVLNGRTFYNEDGTTMTTEEFFDMLDLEMSSQYEYIGDLGYGYEYCNPNNSAIIAAYNYYLDNKK